MLCLSVFASARAVLEYLRLPDNSRDQNSQLSSSAARVLQDLGQSFPDLEDLQLMSEVTAVFSGLAGASEILVASPDMQLSMVWYVVDQIVGYLESPQTYSVFSWREGAEVRMDSSQLSAPVRAMKEVICHLLRSAYLSPTMKSERHVFYDVLCKATLLDPRTKDFKFFTSLGLAGEKSGQRSPAAEEMYVRGVRSVHDEMLRELAEFMFHEERVPAVMSLWTILRNIKQPLMRPSLDNYGGPSGGDDDDVIRMMGGKKRRATALRDNVMALDPEVMQQRQRRMEEACLHELNAYLALEKPCADQDIGSFEILQWWNKNFESFPILAQLARRYCGIRTNAVNLARMQEVFAKLHARERGMLSPGLVDAIVFLFVNGFLNTTVPDDVFERNVDPFVQEPAPVNPPVQQQAPAPEGPPQQPTVVAGASEALPVSTNEVSVPGPNTTAMETDASQVGLPAASASGAVSSTADGGAELADAGIVSSDI